MALSRIDLKSLLNSKVLKTEWVEELTKGFGDYEKKIRAVVHDLDLRGREAKVKGLKQLDQLAVHVKKTGIDLEKKITRTVNQESDRLNRKVNEVLSYLKTLSQGEIAASASSPKAAKSAKSKKPAVSKKGTKAKSSARTKKVLSAKKGSSRESASNSGPGLAN